MVRSYWVVYRIWCGSVLGRRGWVLHNIVHFECSDSCWYLAAYETILGMQSGGMYVLPQHCLVDRILIRHCRQACAKHYINKYDFLYTYNQSRSSKPNCLMFLSQWTRTQANNGVLQCWRPNGTWDLCSSFLEECYGWRREYNVQLQCVFCRSLISVLCRISYYCSVADLINGTYACSNNKTLNDMMKREFGFQGCE